MSDFNRSLARIAAILSLFSIGACSSGSPSSAEDQVDHRLLSTFGRDPSDEADFLVDFGKVAVGERKEEWIELRNAGDSTLVVMADELQKPFGHDLPTAGLLIDGRSTSKIRFDFEPGQESSEPLQRIIELRTNEGEGRTYTVRLLGSGIQPSLKCTHASLDFGLLPVRSTRSLPIVCTNRTPAPIELRVDWFGHFTGEQQSSFSSEVEGSVDGWVKLDSGASTRIHVIFSPQSLGEIHAVLEIGDPRAKTLATVQVAGMGVASAVRVEASDCLDFGEVALGETATRPLVLRNLDTGPIQIEMIAIWKAGTELSVTTEVPLELAGEANTDVEIAFHPTQVGPFQSSIEFHTNDPRSEGKMITACLEGYGGGSSLNCKDASIDFSMVAVGMPARASYTCINDGEQEEENPVAPLLIDGLVSTKAEFSARVVNEDGTEGPKSAGYRVGESFRVEVLYVPTAEGIDEGEIVLESRAVPGGVLATPLSGRGRSLPPCEFILDPPRLPFGVVAPGESLTQFIQFRNVLGTSCLIHDLRLAADSSDTFSVTPFPFVELLGHEVLMIPVTFAPSESEGPVVGAIEFQISNVERMQQRVGLTGTAAEACLEIGSQVVDFGIVEPGCQSRDRWLSVSNRCGVPLTVRRLETTSTGSFFLKERPFLERTLHPNEWFDLSIAFLPMDEGTFHGSITIEVEGSAPYIFTLIGEATPIPIQTDTFRWETKRKVDVLWVMDNSGSFSPYQDRIAQNISSFLQAADQVNADYRIAVTTSGLKPSGSCPGGANGGEDGRFFPIDGSRPRILSPTTPDLAMHLASNMKVGTCHGTEPYLEAAFRALSEPLISERKSSRHSSDYDDGNTGFLRREAALSIIFVADEEEQSTSYGRSLNDYLAFFQSLKKHHNMLRIHAITGSKSTHPSSCNNKNGDRFHTLIDETSGTWLDICTPINDSLAWAEGLKRLSEGAFGFPATFFLRGNPDDRTGDGDVAADDIELFVDGEPLPHLGPDERELWIYDPASNAIEFTEGSAPAADAQITATYRVTCGAP